MSESDEIKTMRAMSWERAKGELNAYLQTFWSSYLPNGEKRENGFEADSKRIEDFIRDMEDNSTSL